MLRELKRLMRRELLLLLPPKLVLVKVKTDLKLPNSQQRLNKLKKRLRPKSLKI